MKISIEDPREKQEEQEIKVNYGDLFEWTECPSIEDNTEHNPCMCAYYGAVSLKNPMSDWKWTEPKQYIQDAIKRGEIRLLPKGYKVTIEQE